MTRSAVLLGVLCLYLTFALPARNATGATGVLAWEQSFRKDTAGSGQQMPIAARELADRSTLIVATDNSGVSFVHYDVGGNVLSAVAVYPQWSAQLAGIDPFGAVFLVAQADHSQFLNSLRGDVWILKYDGFSGRALWSSAQTWDGPDHRQDLPLEVFVDAQGNPLVIGETNPDYYYPGAPFALKYDGLTGSPLWTPITSTNAYGVATLDAAGDIYIANLIGSPNENQTSKYSGANGQLLWQSFESPRTIPRVARTGAGRLIVAGDTLDGFQRIQTRSSDAMSGAILWSSTYGNPAPAEHLIALDVAVGGQGQVFVAGSSNQGGGYFTIKLDASTGAVSWGPVLESSGANPGTVRLVTAMNGDLFEDDLTYDGSGFHLATRRYDGSSGATVWGPEVTDIACCNAPVGFVTSDGRLFYSLPSFNPTDFDVASFARDAATGQMVTTAWTFKGVAGGFGYLNDLTLDSAGDVLVTGNVTTVGGNGTWATFKYDHATGSVVWGPVFFDYDDLPSYWPYQVLTDSAGNAVVIGFGKFGKEEYRLVVKKYAAANGAELWTSAVYTNFTPYGVMIDSAGNPAILGQVVTEPESGGYDYDNAVLKLSGSTGLALWGPILYNSEALDYPTSFAIDGAGDLFATGLSYGQEPFAYVLKYSGATGALLWGPKTIADARPNFVTVDPSGNPIVTGYQIFSMFTVKYDGATGNVSWGPILTPSSGDSSSGYWVTTNASGDAFVAGSFYVDQGDGVFNNDVTTTKFRGSDGAILWGPVFFDGPAHFDDYPYSVVVDAAGDAVVAGETEVGRSTYRAAVLKYNGTSGNPIWGPVILGEAGRTDVNGLAVRGGSVYVAGVVGGTYRTFALVESLGIATTAQDIPVGACGQDYQLTLAAQNGSGGYSWSIVSGTLPPGLHLSAGGQISGTPSDVGSFEVLVQVKDSLGASAQRDFTLTIGHPASVVIIVSTDAACSTTLSVPSSWIAYEWLPDGQTTPSIVVTPSQTTTYGVRLTDATGCVVEGAITIPGSSPGDVCIAPVVGSMIPGSGPASGGTPVAIAGAHFQVGAVVVIGNAIAAGVAVIGPDTISATTPSLPAGAVQDLSVMNPDGRRGVLKGGWITDFLDVLPAHPFHDYILKILRNGISAGCGGGNYCPDAAVTRGQMAVFLLKAEHGSSYAPPPCTGVFTDVACPSQFADWIEQLAAEGITGGCGGGNFCPANPVTRAQMAIFLLKTLLGSSYTPPGAVGIFGDVPVGSFAADWIEDLYGREITGGCSASPLLYCPNNPNTRGQMAVFLTKTFALP